MATAAERTPPAAKARARARVHPSRRKDTGMAYIMLAPVLVLLGIFVIWPAIQAVYLSFFDWSFYTDSEFVGWKNFRNVLIDDNFWDAIVRGLQFVLMTVPLSLVLSFLVASLATSVSRKVSTVVKVSIYIPSVISGVIAWITLVLKIGRASGRGK